MLLFSEQNIFPIGIHKVTNELGLAINVVVFLLIKPKTSYFDCSCTFNVTDGSHCLSDRSV